MAELTPDPRGAHDSRKWAKTGTGDAQGHVCHQRLLEGASRALPSLPATPGKTSEAGAWRGPWSEKCSSVHGEDRPLYVPWLQCTCPSLASGHQPQARSPGSGRVEADEGYQCADKFPQPEPGPLPPFLPPLQLPIRLTSLQFAASLLPTHVLQRQRYVSPSLEAPRTHLHLLPGDTPASCPSGQSSAPRTAAQ